MRGKTGKERGMDRRSYKMGERLEREGEHEEFTLEEARKQKNKEKKSA